MKLELKHISIHCNFNISTERDVYDVTAELRGSGNFEGYLELGSFLGLQYAESKADRFRVMFATENGPIQIIRNYKAC